MSTGATAENIYEVRVPGAFELPMAAAQLLRQSRVDAVVCLGALVRGETPHFDVLAHATANAIQAVARSSGGPVTFGVVTCDSSEQAVERAGGEVGNKGTEAAIAAMEMIALYARLEGESRDGVDGTARGSWRSSASIAGRLRAAPWTSCSPTSGSCSQRPRAT